MNTFISVVVEFAAKAFPSFLLRRLFHQSKIGKEISIDLHGSHRTGWAVGCPYR